MLRNRNLLRDNNNFVVVQLRCIYRFVFLRSQTHSFLQQFGPHWQFYHAPRGGVQARIQPGSSQVGAKIQPEGRRHAAAQQTPAVSGNFGCSPAVNFCLLKWCIFPVFRWRTRVPLLFQALSAFRPAISTDPPQQVFATAEGRMQ